MQFPEDEDVPAVDCMDPLEPLDEKSFSSSSSAGGSETAHYARLHVPGHHHNPYMWEHDPEDPDPYIMVHLYETSIVTGVVTQGNVTEFKVATSDDGITEDYVKDEHGEIAVR